MGKPSILRSLAAAGAVSMTLAPVADAKVVRFQRVPEARIATIPDDDRAPRTVRASSRTDGIHPTRGPRRFLTAGSNPQAYLLPTKAGAREFDREGFVPSDSPQNQGCFTVVPASAAMGGESFPNDQANYSTVWAESKSKRRVSIVRAQRFVAGSGDEATLHITDAYVDAVSLGAKLIGRSTVKMKRVAIGPRNVGVYAAREGSKVHFVVTSADRSGVPKVDADVVRGMQLSSGFDGGFSSCSFLLTTMDAETRGGGTAATVSVRVPLSVETSEVEFRSPFGDEEPRTDTVTEVALRSTGVRLSVSKTSADRTPVISVGFGWQGEAERQRI